MIQKLILKYSPGSIGALSKTWLKIFIDNKKNNSLEEAFYLTIQFFIQSGYKSGFIKKKVTDTVDYLVYSTDGCVANMILILACLNSDILKSLKMGGSIATQSLEVIYEQCIKYAPEYVKMSKTEFVKLVG